MPYDWTDEKIELLRTMKSESANSEEIAARLGDVCSRIVRKKLKQLGLNRPYKKRRGTSKKHKTNRSKSDMPLACSINPDTGFKNEASEKEEKMIRTDWTAREDRIFDLLRLSGIPATDLEKAFREKNHDLISQRIHVKGIVASNLDSDAIRNLRRTISEKIPEILHQSERDDFALEAMVWMTLAGQRCGRDISKIAEICVIPRFYVERVFAWLDIEGIWKVEHFDIPELEAAHYERFAIHCRRNSHLIENLLPERSGAVAALS